MRKRSQIGKRRNKMNFRFEKNCSKILRLEKAVQTKTAHWTKQSYAVYHGGLRPPTRGRTPFPPPHRRYLPGFLHDACPLMVGDLCHEDVLHTQGEPYDNDDGPIKDDMKGIQQ